MTIWPMLLALLQAAAAPLAPWAGTWRLDRPASHFRGEITRIARTPAGYRFDFGAVQFVLPDDGRFHPTVAGRETRLLRIGDGRWRREHRINGRVVDSSTLTLSPDGKTLAIAGEHPGAAPETLTRIGAGVGLAGIWRSTRLGINVPDTLTLAAIGGDRLRWGSPAEGNYYLVTVGGPPATDTGPRATAAATLQVTAGPRGTLRSIERLDGRPYRIRVDRLAPDGATLTETVWPASDPGERQVLVFRRG